MPWILAAGHGIVGGASVSQRDVQVSVRSEYVRAAYRESIAALQQAPPLLPATLLFLAMAHAQLNETEKARTIVERLRTEFPSFTVEGFIRGYPVTNPLTLAAIREGANKACLLPT